MHAPQNTRDKVTALAVTRASLGTWIVLTPPRQKTGVSAKKSFEKLPKVAYYTLKYRGECLVNRSKQSSNFKVIITLKKNWVCIVQTPHARPQCRVNTNQFKFQVITLSWFTSYWANFMGTCSSMFPMSGRQKNLFDYDSGEWSAKKGNSHARWHQSKYCALLSKSESKFLLVLKCFCREENWKCMRLLRWNKLFEWNESFYFID